MDGRPFLGRAELGLRAVAIAIWCFIGARALLRTLQGTPGAPRLAVALWVIYGLAFLATTPRALRLAARFALLGAQTAAALGLSARGIPGFEGLLLAVVAAEAAVVLPLRLAVGYAALQGGALLAAVLATKPAITTLEIVGAHTTFVAFALTAAYLHDREVRARRALAEAHAALVAAQAERAESSRNAERLRISRELHDSVGHHLTALSIQLELASRLAEGRAAEAVKRAHGVSRTMLGEVRAVVTALRTEGPIDLCAALRAMGDNIPAPQVHCALPAALALDSAEAAHVLFRCAQEAVTNAMRHAGAANIWVELTAREDGVALAVRDDGAGAGALREGRGLTGMRERVGALDGRVEVTTANGQGLAVAVWLPATHGG